MQISIGTYITDKNEYRDIVWDWDNPDNLILGGIDDERFIQISADDLLALAGAVEKLKLLWIKENAIA